MSVINFTAQFDVLANSNDGSDEGLDADLIALTGSVTFTPVTADNRLALAPTLSPRAAGVKFRPLTGWIDTDGRLKTAPSGTVGVRLVANDPVFGLERLVYRVDFNLLTSLGEQMVVTPSFFEAPAADVEINLADVLVTTGSPAAPISRIAPTGVRQLTDTSFVFTSGGVDIPSPVDIGTSLVTDFDFRLDDTRTPTDDSVTRDKLEPTLRAALSNVTSEFFRTSDLFVAHADSSTDDTTKATLYGVTHYDTDALPAIGMSLQSTSTSNFVRVGGGTSRGNAATQVELWIGSTTTTPSGSRQAVLTSEALTVETVELRVGINDGTEPIFALNGPAGVDRTIAFRTNGASRWFIRADTAGESGSDVGSDFVIQSRTDAGDLKLQVLRIERSTGISTFGALVVGAASTTSRASLRIPHGTAPSAPVDGDLWTTSADGLQVRVNGTTTTLLSDSALTGKEDTITAGTTSQYWRGDKSFQTLNAAAISDSTTTGRSLLTTADASAARTTLGVAYGSTAGTVTQGNDSRVVLAQRSASTSYDSSYYYFCNSQGANGTSVLTNNALRVSLWLVHESLSIDRLWAEYTVAGSSGCVFRFGIWQDSDGLPGTLVLDGGTAAMDGSPGTVEATVSQTLSPGAYWVGGAVQGGTPSQPTLRTVSAGTLPGFTRMGTSLPAAGASGGVWLQTSVSGSFSDFSATPSVTSAAPRIGFRVA